MRKSIVIKTPAGRRLDLRRIMEFCYDLSETDVMILEWMLNEGGGNDYAVDDLRKVFNLSRATVNRVLSKLADMELIDKRKKKRSGTGRPRYVYSVTPERLYEKLLEDITKCSKEISEYVKTVLQRS